MMKKFFFSSPLTAAILTALTFAACSQSDTIADGNSVNTANTAPQAVEFDTYMGAQGTRAGYAGDITTTVLQSATSKGFGVFAYYSGTNNFTTWSSWDGTAATPIASTEAPNFMYNQQVTWNSANNWDYQPVKYWPNGEDAANGGANPSYTATQPAKQYLSFFAYAPYVENSSTPYDSNNPHVGGDLPTVVGDAVYTESAPSAVQNGIVAMSKNDQKKDMYVKYILNPAANANKFVDLLWGLRGQKDYKEAGQDDSGIAPLGATYNTDLTKQTVDEKVKFLFKHALARVGGNTSETNSVSGSAVSGLKVVVDVDANSSNPGAGISQQQPTYFTTDFSNTKTLVTIEEVNIRDKYTYTHEAGYTGTQETSDFLTDGWFDIMNGKWAGTAINLGHTTDSKGVIYSQIAKANGTALKLNDAIKEVATDIHNASGADWSETTRSTHSGVTTQPQNVYAADQEVPGLLLIPGTNANNTLYVTVKYVVRTADSKLSTGFSEVTQTITNKVNLDGSILEPNKCYTLVMHLGLTSVKFEAVVADWATGNNEYDEKGKEETPGTGNPASVWLPSNVVTANVTATEVAAAAGTAQVNLDNLTGTTLRVVSVDGTVVEQKDHVTNLNITSGTATVSIAYTENSETANGRKGTVVLADDVKTITITIPQAAAAVTPTP